MFGSGYKFTSDDFRNWNKLDWWHWNLRQLSLLEDGKLRNRASIEMAEKFKILLSEVERTGLYIGTKVKYLKNGEEYIGYVEEPLLMGEEFRTNIERTPFSGQNSWSNYILKYAPFSELVILEESTIKTKYWTAA